MPDKLNPEERVLHARMAALTRHAHGDTVKATEPARRGFLAKFEREVDPNGTLDPAERAVRADRALRAHMIALSMKAARARRARTSRGGAK